MIGPGGRQQERFGDGIPAFKDPAVEERANRLGPFASARLARPDDRDSARFETVRNETCVDRLPAAINSLEADESSAPGSGADYGGPQIRNPAARTIRMKRPTSGTGVAATSGYSVGACIGLLTTSEATWVPAEIGAVTGPS